MKKIITGALTLALLVSLSSAYAGAGGANDPLVSKSWIDGTYTEKAVSAGESTIRDVLGGVYDTALNEAKAACGQYAEDLGDYNLSSGYELLSMQSGSSVTMVTGGSFILIDGKGSLTVNNGAVVDIVTGQEVSSGTALSKNHRYFCTENTTAIFKVSEASVGSVNGAWQGSSGVTGQTGEYIDVSVKDWFYKEVMYVRDNELFYDINGTTFRPQENTNRATIVYALWKAAGAPSAKGTANFRDLSEDWYKDAVNWAAENDIVKGYGDGRFGPSDSVTREQIAVFMYRFASYMGRSVSESAKLTEYTDKDKISSWALTEMQWANAVGLIKGRSTTTLNPLGTATRAEMAAIVMRFLENQG